MAGTGRGTGKPKCVEISPTGYQCELSEGHRNGRHFALMDSTDPGRTEVFYWETTPGKTN